MGTKGLRGNIGADTDAIIRESDLISFDGSFGEFAKKLKGMQQTIEDFANLLSNQAPKIRKNLEAIATGQGISVDMYDKLRVAATTIDQMSAAQNKLIASMSETAKTLALANEATNKNAQVTKLWAQQTLAAEGSIDSLNANLKQLTNEWTALSDVEREGAQGQAIIKKLVDETLAIKRLNSAVRDQVNMQLKLDAVNKQLAAARSNEMQNISKVRQELNRANRERELEVKVANTAADSYDQLAAAYELGKLKLKSMAHSTKDQIELFEVESKKLADLYKRMMAMQEATGKHTLSVGDYGKAFRSLSTETGMLVRELPALAVSANTFFLAISNNLPMFMSAITRMKQENKALANQGIATTSVFKTVMKSVLSWQTIVIVALSLLSKYGSKIVDWFKELFKHTFKMSSAMEAFSAQMGVLGEAHKEVAKNSIELDLIVDRLKKCEKGTKEWKDGVAAVNAIMHSNLDAASAAVPAIEAATDAYKKQALQLAINENVIKRLADEAIKESGIAQAALPTTQNDFFSLLPEKYYKEGKQVQLSEADRKKLTNYHEAIVQEFQNIIDNNTKVDWKALGADNIDKFRTSLARGEQNKNIELANVIVQYEDLLDKLQDISNRASKASARLSGQALDLTLKQLKADKATLTQQAEAIKDQAFKAKSILGTSENLFKAIAKQHAALRLYWPIMSDEAKTAIASMYDIEELIKKAGSGSQRIYSKQFEFDPWYEAKKSAEALAEKGATEAETIELWEKKKLAIELVAYKEARDKREKYWADQQKKLEADRKHRLVTEEQYAEWTKAIERQKNLDIEALEAKHVQDTLNIQQEAVEKRTKLFLKAYKNEAASLDEQLKGITDPEKAKQILNELNTMISEIETARDAEGQSAESAEAYRKALEELRKQIASTTSAITKMNIEQVKASTHLQKFGRAASALGQKRNLIIASKNIDELSAAIKKLREQIAGLNPKDTNFETDKAAIQKQINAYISQMQANLNRIDVSKLTSSDDDLITRLIESSIDAAQPEQLLNSLRNLGFGDVVNAYLAEAIGETNDPALVRAFTNALHDNEGDIEAAIASMEPGMQEKMREVLANVGMKAGDDLANIFKKAWNTTKQWFNQTIGYLKDLAQAYVDLAEAKAEAAAEATDAAQEEYEKEKALLEAGYANQVETKWAEYQEKKAIQEEAEADAKAATARMEAIETAQQTMSLITSIANIFAAMSKLGPWGIAAASTMSSIMVASFIAAKSKAREATKVQYGEGHAELIGGGSHASGNDSPLAYDAHGRERRVEAGEVVGIFKKQAVKNIGANRLIRSIDNINKGNYTELATRTIDRGSNLNMLAQSVETSRTDLSKLESGVNKIARQGEKKVYTDNAGNLIVQTPCSKTIYIHKS